MKLESRYIYKSAR